MMNTAHETAWLYAIRSSHHVVTTQPDGPGSPLVQRCEHCSQRWPCDTMTVLALLDTTRAELAALAPLLDAIEMWASAPAESKAERDLEWRLRSVALVHLAAQNREDRDVRTTR